MNVNVDLCLMCGEPIPEGRMICPNCEKKYDLAFEETSDNEYAIYITKKQRN